MACTTCGPETQGQCDACKLVDGDNRFKKVFFCETCKAYLCKDCSDNLPKRALAAGMDFGNKVIKRITKYWELKFGPKKEHTPITTEELGIDKLSVLKMVQTELKSIYDSCPDEKKPEVTIELEKCEKQIKEIEESADHQNNILS